MMTSKERRKQFAKEIINSYPSPVLAARDLGGNETTLREWLCDTKSGSNPNYYACRALQLLKFLRDKGLEPPEAEIFE